MGFGVFIHRTDSIYDDSPAERYQFPSRYLRAVEHCVGDWIIYLEPRRAAETRGYFAVAKVADVEGDPLRTDLHYARIEPGTYLDFPDPVPFRGSDGLPVERGILNDSGGMSGRKQSAVRPLSASDFRRILDHGIGEGLPLPPRTDEDWPAPGFEEPQASFLPAAEERSRASFLVSRLIRDRAFRRLVLKAYGETCAVTGLKLINGGGRAEAEAAHIRPVEADGPDSITNGIALSGTAHWMFDRGLIALDDDLTIRISRQVNDPDGIRAIVNRTGRAFSPSRPLDRPHPHFLGWHRENRFKA